MADLLSYSSFNSISVIQYNFSGSNTDGCFELVFESLEKSHRCRFRIIYGDFLEYIENGILCVPIRITLMRRF